MSNIFLIGPMGAGKTTIGKLLAEKLHYQFYDSDQEIEKRTGASIPWIFDLEGEEGFRLREQNEISRLTQLNHIVLATGGGAILYPQNRNLLSKNGFVVYLKVDIETQLKRLNRCQNRPLLKTHHPKEKLQNLMTEREKYYLDMADISLNTSTLTIPKILKQIMESFKK